MDYAVILWLFLQDVSLTAKKTEDCFLLVWSGWEQGLTDDDDDDDDDEQSRVDQVWTN